MDDNVGFSRSGMLESTLIAIFIAKGNQENI